MVNLLGIPPSISLLWNMNYSVLIGGWIAYFVLHSVFAAGSIKLIASRVMGKGFRYYRLLYSTFATVGLVILLIINSNIPSEDFFESTGLIRYVSLVFTTFGVMLIQISFRQYRLKAFLGFTPEDSRLHKGGVLGWVRHPIYSGLILVVIGFFFFIPNLPTLITSLCILTYLPVGIYLEEKKMISVFGQSYLDYRKEVPLLVPRWSRITGR
jgi:protein-S-isoprenylcysteine O-methyltransferase Ste14